jgi:hypothetical protein
MQQQVENLENLLSSLVRLKTNNQHYCNANDNKVTVKSEVKISTVKSEKVNHLNKVVTAAAITTILNPSNKFWFILSDNLTADHKSHHKSHCAAFLAV